jgi:predicted phage tail component-like protein
MQFKGIKKDYLTVLKGRKRPPFAPIQRDILTIPGLPGGYLQNTNTGIRTIEVPVLIKAINRVEIQKIKEDLAEWLISDKPEELIFDDESDRMYYALVDGSVDIDELVNTGKGTITFICPDPYKYGPEKDIEFVDSATFNVEGTVESYPVIEVEIDQDATYLAVSDGERINLIGNPTQAEQQPFEAETRKFWSECSTLTGWTGTTTIEGGTNKGTLKAASYYFYTDDYGSDTAWHGPAQKTSIGATLQDFKMDALVTQIGASGQIGSIEVDVLDASNKIVAKMLLTKRSAGSYANWARMRAGSDANGYNIMDYRGANDWTWANFDGLLRIQRVGNIWTAFVCQIDSKGNQTARAGFQWVDADGIASAAISQIQVQLWQYGTVPATTQKINDLKVYQINSPGSNQVPYVARAGDVIIFDHQNDIIRRNGEDITKDKAFIGEYFPLEKGLNNIYVEPAAAIKSSIVRWRPKWL